MTSTAKKVSTRATANMKAKSKQLANQNETSKATDMNAPLTNEERSQLGLTVSAQPSMNENDQSNEPQDLEGLIAEVQRKGFEDMPWWFDVPKKERLRSGDVIYHMGLDRFGIFISPARKHDLVRIRLLKVSSKVAVYTRDWFVPFESLILVKRDDSIKRGFVETDHEYVRRAGKINRKEREATIDE